MRHRLSTGLVVVLGACQPAQSTQSPGRSDSVAAAPAALPRAMDPTVLSQGPSLSSRTQGKVVVLDLWATWCEPCRISIPKVQRLHEALAGEGLVVVGVHAGGEADDVLEYVRSAGMTYPQYLDENLAYSLAVGSRSVPVLLVVDRTGKIVYRGTELNAAALEAIRAQLAQQP